MNETEMIVARKAMRVPIVIADGSPELDEWFRNRLAVGSVAAPNGCRLWTGCVQPSGHGRLRIRRTEIKAHRKAWELQNGPIPEGMCVCHKCDTPACINPDHLFLGTIADNNADMIAKGRQARGVKNGISKLNESAVLQMRRQREEGMSFGQIAKRANVSFATAYSAINGKTWAHVGPDHRQHSPATVKDS